MSGAGKPIRISLWSGPRNVSTALMYSFSQRDDTESFDEPLYAHYLLRETDRPPHPAEEEIIRAQESDGNTVVKDLFLGPSSKPVRFFKNMAHHLVALDWGFLQSMENVILTRDPRDMLVSYANTIPEFGLSDTGYPQLQKLSEAIVALGREPIVLDATTLLKSPERVLRRLCDRLEIPFQESMLRWPAGPKKEDGVWAPHWYHNAHKSAGFAPYRPKSEPFPERLKSMLEPCQRIYDSLSVWMIQ